MNQLPPGPGPGSSRNARKLLRDLFLERLLGIHDTPHRVALGVALGFLVAWTPTLGFQIVLYVTLAGMVRANKLSGIPILFISNPFTAVPFYYFTWWVGYHLWHGQGPASDAVKVAAADPVEGPWWEIEFWQRVFQQLLAVGGETWLGGLALGLATAIPSYVIMRWLLRVRRSNVS